MITIDTAIITPGKLKKTFSSLSRYDPVTKMLTRRFFRKKLNDFLTDRDEPVGVLMLDLDRFRHVNEVAGHDVGEDLLRKVALRLISITPQDCLWANLWGDKFFVAIPSIKNDCQLCNIAQNILKTFDQYWVVGNREFFLSIGIGIALYPDHGHDAATLMKSAHLALAKAKEYGGNTYQFYNPGLSCKAIENFQIEKHLRNALDNSKEEFFLHYQPRIDLRTGEVASFEALVRWHGQELGELAPGLFIPVAEDTGLISKIDAWVLTNACQQIRDWQSRGFTICVSVNLSATQLYNEELLDFVAHTLDEKQINPAQLELEITETMVMKNIDRAVATLKKLKQLGVHIALDDFGTGYSSLTNLKRLPIDTLKIDKSFVLDAEHSAESKSIIQVIIALGQTLNLKVTAEGVETESQLALLRGYACHEAQGFYFSRPVSSEDAYGMLVDGNAAARKLKIQLALDSSFL